MSVKIEHIAKITITYKNCEGHNATGQIFLNAEAETFKFHQSVDSTYGSKGTFNIEDIRKLLVIYDQEKAKLPQKAKTEKPLIANKVAKPPLAKKKTAANKSVVKLSK